MAIENTILQARVKGLGKVYKAQEIEDAYSIIERDGELISFRDLAFARIVEGKNSLLTTEESAVAEGFVYVPEQKPVFLTGAINPLNYSLDKPTIDSCPRKFSTDYSRISKKQIEQIRNILEEDATKNLFERRALSFNTLDDQILIPTNRLNENDITLWAFKDIAKDYGMFLRDLGVEYLNIRYDERDFPFITFPIFGGCPINCGPYDETDSEIYLGSGETQDFPSIFKVVSKIK